jgi:nucleotide-binding universal stress UspA family protein
MDSATLTAGSRPAPDCDRPSVFDRVLVGVDGSEAGFEACRQAVRLADPAAPIEVVAVVHLSDAVHAGLAARELTDVLQQEAEDALAEATRIIGERAQPRFVNGYITSALRHEIEDVHGTLVALGSHGHHRAAEMILGGVAGELLHGAPCSVLIARPTETPDAFPRSIVVGHDGSPGADLALAAARELSERLGASVRVVTALRGKGVWLGHVLDHVPDAVEVMEKPVPALVAAARQADLLVVGSRGLHGLHALGSVSERVAHRAASSVLVVREPAWQQAEETSGR